MFVRATNQMGEDGTTLIARQVLLGPGSWTLARPGGQFNSRGPYPLGSRVGSSESSESEP